MYMKESTSKTENESSARLRGYVVYVEDEDNIAVVAETSREAKKLALNHLWYDEYTEIKVRWLKDANISGLEKGVIRSNIDGLKRGFYIYIEEKCTICKNDYAHIVYECGKFRCSDCDNTVIL